MKNSDLIAMLSVLPLDADVLVHGEVDGEDFMFFPRDANAEFDCDDQPVIRLNCDTPEGIDDV